MLKGSSDELQNLVLAGILKFPDVCGRFHKYIQEKFFASIEFKLIFKAISKYYTKYMVVPAEKELLVLIESVYTEDYGNIENIKIELSSLYKIELKSEEFVESTIREFIARCSLEETFKVAYDYINNNGSIDAEMIRSRLIRDVTLDCVKSPAMNLADLDTIEPAMEDALGSQDNPIAIKLFLDNMNMCFQYGALIPGTLNLITAPPGRGKTTWLINQGISAAKQGFKTLHVFLGDMTKHDARLRYLSCMTGTDTNMLVKLDVEGLKAFTRKWNMSGILSNILITSYPAEYLTVNGLLEEITAIQKTQNVHFHQIIIDYDENISSDDTNMYVSGGDIYNNIYRYAATNKSVIFIASQPKPTYWNSEIIPMEAASESSKKQKIIDLMLTIGSPSKISSLGTLYIAKNRRGETDRYFRIRKNGSNARIVCITEDEYQRGKQEEQRDNNR